VLARTAVVPDAKIIDRVAPAVSPFLGATEELTRQNAADALAHALKFLGPERALDAARQTMFDSGALLRWQQRQARCRTAGTLAQCSPVVFAALAESCLLRALTEDILSDVAQLRTAAV
jgi:hypothetical protein